MAERDPATAVALKWKTMQFSVAATTLGPKRGKPFYIICQFVCSLCC